MFTAIMVAECGPRHQPPPRGTSSGISRLNAPRCYSLGMGEFNPWYDWRPSRARRLFVLLLLLFAGSTYMYVWCELFTPRWYSGRFSSWLGMLPSNSERRMFDL